MRKPTMWISDQVRYKTGCAATEVGWRLHILDVGTKALISFTVAGFAYMQIVGFLMQRLIWCGMLMCKKFS